MTTSDVIQLIAVLTAVGASIVAIVIATQDRRTQLRIAREARRHSRLELELEYAIRLSANRNMGGSVDPAETKRLGAEAMALVGVLGDRWVPEQYAFVMEGRTPKSLLEEHMSADTPDWIRWRTESTVAVQRIREAIYGEERGLSGDPKPRQVL